MGCKIFSRIRADRICGWAVNDRIRIDEAYDAPPISKTRWNAILYRYNRELNAIRVVIGCSCSFSSRLHLWIALPFSKRVPRVPFRSKHARNPRRIVKMDSSCKKIRNGYFHFIGDTRERFTNILSINFFVPIQTIFTLFSKVFRCLSLLLLLRINNLFSDILAIYNYSIQWKIFRYTRFCEIRSNVQKQWISFARKNKIL